MVATFNNVLVAYHGHPRAIFNFTVKVYWFKDLTWHCWKYRVQAEMASCNGLAHIVADLPEDVLRKVMTQAEDMIGKQIGSVFPDTKSAKWEGGI